MWTFRDIVGAPKRRNDACSLTVHRALCARFVQSLAVSHLVDLAVYISAVAHEFGIDPAFGEASSFNFEDVDADELHGRSVRSRAGQSPLHPDRAAVYDRTEKLGAKIGDASEQRCEVLSDLLSTGDLFATACGCTVSIIRSET